MGDHVGGQGMMRRRQFLNSMTLVGAASVWGSFRTSIAAEPVPETKRIRLSKVPSACVAPQYVAEQLLRAEGFNQIEYVNAGSGGLPMAQALGRGQFDIGMNFAAPLVVAFDDGLPIVLLAGVHVGCFELFSSDRIRTFSDLKGKTAAVLNERSSQHIFLASIATTIGIDPNRDIRWASHPVSEAKQLLAQGKIDAFLGFPPDSQELRAKKVGRVLLNSAIDRPWSQYFCCLIAANREFAGKYPVAAKRAVRAILKASDLCAADPSLGAKAYLAHGFDTNPEYALQAFASSLMGNGANTTLRRQCGSMRCDCEKQAWSEVRRKKSSRRVLTGVYGMSSRRS